MSFLCVFCALLCVRAPWLLDLVARACTAWPFRLACAWLLLLPLLVLGPADQHKQGEPAQGEQRQKQVVGSGLVLLEEGFASPHLWGGQLIAVLQ